MNAQTRAFSAARASTVQNVPYLLVVVGLVWALLAGCGSSGVFTLTDDPDGEADYAFVIPAGSGEAIDAGEPLDLLPGSMTVKVGEVIEIVNDDDRGHLVGPFFVGAQETVRQEFASPGTFEGKCSVHSSGQIIIEVVE